MVEILRFMACMFIFGAGVAWERGVSTTDVYVMALLAGAYYWAARYAEAPSHG